MGANPRFPLPQFLLDEAQASPPPVDRAPLADEDSRALDAYSQVVSSVVDKVGPAVCLVEIRNGQRRGSGCGFAISPDGLVVTNCHVVQTSGTVEFNFRRVRVFQTVFQRVPDYLHGVARRRSRICKQQSSTIRSDWRSSAPLNAK